MPDSNRWRKIYQGKIHYVGIGHCNSKTDREGYKIALAEWQELREKMESAPTEGDKVWYQLHLEKQERLAREEERRKTARYLKIDGVELTEAELERRMEKAVAKIEGVAPVKDSVGAAIKEFLATKRQRHEMGVLSASRVRSCEQHLRTVEEFLGTKTPVTVIDETMVKRYWECLVHHVTAEDYGQTTAADRWALFKEWVRSLYSIATPRNLNSRDLSIPKPRKKVVAWTVEEVRETLTAAPERLKIWILLMLNCGMYSGDISNLKPSEVDWEQGRIIRKRSKTEDLDSTPTVNYLLWPQTFKMLKQHGKRRGDHVFVNRCGEPLVQQHFKDNGRMENQDLIYDCWRRTFPDLYGRLPLKSLRKTGASLLDTHDVYCNCVEHYLAHAAKTVTDRSYRNYSQERLDNALRWLGEQFGVK